MSFQVQRFELKAMIEDQVGICVRCGGMTHPVAPDEMGVDCDVCRRPLVVGVIPAVELGAVAIVPDHGTAMVIQ